MQKSTKIFLNHIGGLQAKKVRFSSHIDLLTFFWTGSKINTLKQDISEDVGAK
jgi:hypothetical protein